ncbi:hypothetical protein DWY53_20925, partial [Phocaeicola vulgatus]
FRKEHHGTGNYVHLYGNPEDRNELHSRDFKDWQAVAFKHPGYLDDMWKQACDAYAWSSFNPEIRGETDIMIYGEELHNDLQLMPEEERDTYIAAYRQKLSAQLSVLSRCANPMVTGRSGFDYYRQEKTNRSYQNCYEEFRNWRKKVLETIRRKKEAARPEEEKQEKAWQTLKRDIKSSADTIHGIDTGQCRGYSRALFVSSILNKVSTLANHGEVEIVRRAVDFISEYNARVKKPVITPRNKFFQLPELAERMREKLKAMQSRENKEVPFEGGTLVWNYGEDRLQILFDRIPEDSRRKELKSSGFRWSPKNKAWQRQLTSNALGAAKRLLDLQNI